MPGNAHVHAQLARGGKIWRSRVSDRVARCSATCSARSRPTPKSGSQRVLACNVPLGLDARAFGRIFSSHELGWWREKAFSKDFCEGYRKDLCWGFFSPARATCRGLKDPSRPTAQLYQSLSGIGKGIDKGFPEGVARRIADLGARRRDRVSSRLPQGIEQPAAQYAASRAHAGLQLRRARQLEVFRGEDVPSTST
jgi:hypothetical protein